MHCSKSAEWQCSLRADRFNPLARHAVASDRRTAFLARPDRGNITPLAKTGGDMRLRLLWIAVGAGLSLLTPADAELAPQWRSCTGTPDVDWDQQLRSCSTLIQSGRETTSNRATAFNSRGNAY